MSGIHNKWFPPVLGACFLVAVAACQHGANARAPDASSERTAESPRAEGRADAAGLLLNFHEGSSPEEGLLIVGWPAGDAPRILGIYLESLVGDVVHRSDASALRDLIRSPAIVRSVSTAAGLDTVHVDMQQLAQQFVGPRIRARAFLASELSAERFRGSVFVQGGLRGDGKVVVEPGSVPDRFSLLRESDATPAWRRLENERRAVLSGKPDSLVYEVELRGALAVTAAEVPCSNETIER